MNIRNMKIKNTEAMIEDDASLTGSALRPLKELRRAAAALLLLAGAALVFASCDDFPGFGGDEEGEEGTEASQEEEESVFAVNTTEAKLGVIENYIEVNGDVVARTTVETFPDNSGKLTRFYVDQGDWVRKDQVIAEVDPSRPGSQFEPSPVKAPISGTVVELPAEEGSTVSPQMSIARVSKMDDLQIRTHVAERFIGSMKTGLRAIVTTEAFPDREYEGRVSKLSPVIDPQTRMMEIKINLAGSNEGLKAGMFVKVKIITERKENVIKIPVECVAERFEDTYVFVVEKTSESTAPANNGKENGGENGGENGDAAEKSEETSEETRAKVTGTVSRRQITTGITIDQQVEVLEGLEAGEEVVTQGQTLLEDGAKVRVISREDQE